MGRTGTVALVALAHMDFLESSTLSDSQRKKYHPYLKGYVNFLIKARRNDHLWHGSYDLKTGVPSGMASPYFDGESLLALVKAAKYHGRSDLKSDLITAAEAGYKKNVVDALAKDPDSSTTSLESC